MKKTIEGIGKRSVRKQVSITPQLETILTELSLATNGKYTQAEVMSIILDLALNKSDSFINFFEKKYVDNEEYRIRIMYNQDKERKVRTERMN